MISKGGVPPTACFLLDSCDFISSAREAEEIGMYSSGFVELDLELLNTLQEEVFYPGHLP